jgi:PAS domain S-box-containing protein
MNNLISFIHNELASGRIPRGGIPGDAPHADELNRLVVYLTSIQQFSMALANGDLSATLTDVKGPVAGSLKSLHASLKHLTWQTKQIAAGDFSQRVDFMGEFSDAFNIMVQRLDQSRTALEVLNLRLREDNIKLQNLADELREKEERLRHIAENVSDVIWTLDSAMEGFTYVSPSIASLRGLSVDEALREPLERTMTQESLAHLRSSLSDRVTDPGSMGKAGALSEKMEIEQICRDGRIISVEVVITAITDAHGRLKEFVGVSRDITARKLDWRQTEIPKQP